MTKNFTNEDILKARETLEDGDIRDMLSELLSMKNTELTLYTLCQKYFQHPNASSKTWKKNTRPKIRKYLEKMDRFLSIKN